MNTYYFTFGCGSRFHDKYIRITASDWEKAREIMFEQFGNKWAFQYDEEKFAGKPEEYSLSELAAWEEAA